MKTISAATTVMLLLLCGCGSQGPQVELEKAVRQISKQLPRQLDEFTVWTKVEAGDRTIIYTYRIQNISPGEIRANQQPIKEAIRAGLKANKHQLSAYVKHRIPMQYVYVDQEGNHVLEFTINPWEL